MLQKQLWLALIVRRGRVTLMQIREQVVSNAKLATTLKPPLLAIASNAWPVRRTSTPTQPRLAWHVIRAPLLSQALSLATTVSLALPTWTYLRQQSVLRACLGSTKVS